MALPWLELCFSFQVNVPCQENALVDVVIERFYTHTKLGMIGEDHVRRLSLLYERSDDPINFMEFFL